MIQHGSEDLGQSASSGQTSTVLMEKNSEEELSRAMKGLHSLKIEDELWTSLDNSIKVFKGRDLFSLVYVQVKRINKQCNDERILNDLVHEVRILQMLRRHNNIVSHLEWYQTKKHVWVVSELVAGGNLRSVLVHHSLETFSVIDLARDVLRGLECVHESGVVHGDLRPDNIWLTENGVAKLAGFFVSNVNEVDPENTEFALSADRVREHALQYAEYMAPEVLRMLVKDKHAPWKHQYPQSNRGSGELKSIKLSKESDIWSVAVTLFESYRGTPPFTGTSFMHLAERVVLDEPYYVDKLDKTNNSATEQAEFATAPLLRCMFEKDPAKRATCGQLLARLDTKLQDSDQG